MKPKRLEATWVVAAGCLLVALPHYLYTTSVAHGGRGDATVLAQSSSVDAAQRNAWEVLSAFAQDANKAELGQGGTDSWKSVCTYFEKSCGSPIGTIKAAGEIQAHRFLSLPTPSLPLQGGVNNATNGDTIFYNQRAQTDLQPCNHQACTSAVVFNRGAMIGRFAYYLIPIDAPNCEVIKVFNPEKDTAQGTYTQSIIVKTPTCQMPAGVASAPQSKATSAGIPKDSANPGSGSCDTNSATTPVLDIGCFFYVQIMDTEAQGEFRTRVGNQPSLHSYAIVVGIHLIFKNSFKPFDWIWATFWWSANPGYHGGTDPEAGSSCAVYSLCPTSSSYQWSHYVMNTVVQPADGQRFQAASNPYLDQSQTGHTSSKPRTNCIVCHSFAATPLILNAGHPNSSRCGAQVATSLTTQNWQEALINYRALYGSMPYLEVDRVWSVAEQGDSSRFASVAYCGSQ